MKHLFDRIRRSIDHDLSLGYAKQLRWLCFLFVILFLLILIILCMICVIDKDFDMGSVNLPGTAFLLLTDPGNLSGVLPVNHSWLIGIIYAFITIAGAVVFGGLLISLLSNSVQRRVENIASGNVYYRLRDHIVVIGYDTIVPSLMSQIMKKWQDRDVLLLTKKSPVEVREALSTVVDIKSKHLIIYSGQRSSESDLLKLEAETAHEIFIIGNRESDDHDALNIDCLSKLVSMIGKRPPKEKPIVNILLENPATQTVLQSTNLAKKWQNVVNVIPFSFYENWARKALGMKDDKGFLLRVNRNSDEQLNIVVFGMSRMGITLAVEAAHALHFPRKKDGSVRKTILTFISLNADKEMRLFRTRYRQIFEIQSSRYIDFIGSVDNQEAALPVIKEMPPTYFTGKDADFLDIEFEFVRGDAFSEDIHHLLSERIEKDYRRLALFACTGKDTTDMNIALYMPEMVLRHADLFVRQHHSGLLLDWLRERSKVEKGLYSRIYPFGMEDTTFDLEHLDQRMGVLINYYYCNHDEKPDLFSEDYVLGKAEQEEANSAWSNGAAVADQWSSSYCCMSFDRKLAQWGITSLEPSNIENIKEVINGNIDELGYIEHNRWNMEKLLLGFRKPHAEEQSEIDECRKTVSDKDKEKKAVCKYLIYKKRHIHDYLRSFDDLANIVWKDLDREKDDVRKIDYDMLRQIPWIIKNCSKLSIITNDMEKKQYIPQPIDTSDIQLPEELNPLLEAMAKNVHETWAQERTSQGWTYGEKRDNAQRHHPCLVPYEDLPEEEKVYDRNTSTETLKMILKSGFKIEKDG